MAETTDALNRNPESSGDAGGRRRSIDEIERDIQKTQSEMSRTIDEIQYRLSPETIKRRAKARMRENSRRLMDRIKENPGAAAVMGLGAWMLFRDRGHSSGNWEFHDHMLDEVGYCGVCGVAIEVEELGPTDRIRGRAREAGSQMKHRVEDVAHEASDRASEIAHRASDAAHRATARTADAGHRMGEGARRMARRTRSAAARTTDRLEDNPLLLGALGIAVGAIVGGLIPESDREREMFGDARDRALDRARNLAREKAEQVRHVAEAAKDAAVEEGKNAARRENLTGDGRADSRTPEVRTGMSPSLDAERDRI